MRQNPWGKTSRDYLKSITPKIVDLRVHTKDRYGRQVAEVFSRETNVNLKMVADGYAAVYPRYCEDKPYYLAQSKAKKSQLGIWQYSGLHQTPWIWRKKYR